MRIQFALAVSLLLLTACTSPSSTDSANNGANQAGSSNTADNGCKDFPTPLYPTTTSLQCEHSGDRYTAYVETADSVDQVTKWYQTQIQSSGWQPDPDPLIDPKHTVVSLKKPPGYATVTTFVGSDGKGCSFQIHAYPKGNAE